MIQIGDRIAYVVSEMSTMLHVSEKTIRKYCAAGTIQAKKIGKKWHATKEALQRFLEADIQQEPS